jgi:hypothetical protein
MAAARRSTSSAGATRVGLDRKNTLGTWPA